MCYTCLGTAGDSMAYHDGSLFSTKDQENDEASRDCANVQKGAWWYKACYDANLNGLYYQGKYSGGWADGIVWEDWKGLWYSIKRTEMKIRPLEF